MAVNLSPVGGVAGQFFDNNGNPLTGGKIFTYSSGTTTNQATYISSAGVTAHTNPIILDAAGRVPGGEIWLTDGLQYKFVIKTANDVLIGTYDNIIGINSNFVNFLTETEVQTATAGQTVFTLTTMQYQLGTNNLTVYVDGVNQIDGSTYSYIETSSTVVTFTAGLHVGALVKFTTAQTLSTGVTDASLVTYSPPFTNAVETTVENKLAQTVSVKDFGAVGDGTTDDTAAIQAAIDSFGGDAVNLYIPAGTYKTTAALTVLGNLNTIYGDGDNSIIAPVGAIDVLVIGNGVDGVNFGTVRDFSIASADGLQTRGIWGRWLRQFHFVNIVMRTNTVGLKNFSTAAIQCDFSWSCNFTSVTIVGFLGKGFWLGQDPLTASNQCNDFTLTGCHAYSGDGIGYHLKGSGNSLLGCLAEECAGGGVQGNFVPGINVSGGYYENNGATSGFSFYFTEAQNAGGISNVFINNFNIAGSQCVVLDSVDNFTIIGCNFRVHAAGIGVELDTNVSNVYLIGNRNEGLTGTLYGGVSYPLNARISDTFTRFADLYTTDITTDSTAKTVYIGRLSATLGDNTVFKVRSRQNIDVFVVDTDATAIVLPVAGTGITLKSPNGLVTKTLTIDNTGNIALL